MPTTTNTGQAPYDLTQTEDDIAALQGSISNMEEILYLLLTAPQPPNVLSDRVQLYANAAQNLPAWADSNSMNAVIPGTYTSWFPGNTVTQAALNNLASQQIQANNANVNSVYEIECWGNGTWGSTQQTLQFACQLASNTMAQVTLGSSWFNASIAFRWHVTVRVICHTTGSGGTWSSLIFGEISAFANAGVNLLPNTGSQATGAFCSCESSGTTAVSTLTQNSLGLSAAWGSTTGASTLTSQVAAFKRVF